MTYRIDFEPAGIRLDCDQPLTIATAARLAGLSLQSVCGGKGTCGKCRVHVTGGQPVTLAADPQEGAGWCLACQTMVCADCKVYIPALSMEAAQVVQTENGIGHFEPHPAVQTFRIQVATPSLEDQSSDFKRTVDALQAQHGLTHIRIGLPALVQLSQVLRSAGGQVQVAVRAGEIIASAIAPGKPPVGLAVDVGTTKLACYLVDLESGQALDSKGVMNPQIAYGEDLMARLETVLVDPHNEQYLQEEVITAINTAAAELCALQGLTPEDLLDLCLVGNTAMHHLFLGLPVTALARAPFVPALNTSLSIPAAQIGLRAAPGANLYLPAPIAGFIGSDHLAFLVAAGFGNDHRTRLGIDIGTNTEIALQAHGQILSCSAASGPAFEGAHVSHGMRAAPGAIERIHIDAQGEVHCQVIGDIPAIGICGSGVLDALAEMRRAGILNLRGRLQPEMPGVQQPASGVPEFILSANPDGQRTVVITQSDIDQILLAKGAIRTGIDVLMNASQISAEDIDEIVIAGAFGSYLDPRNAMRIGLLPDLPLQRVHAIGNAAGGGAHWMLASTPARHAAEELAQKIGYLELTLYPAFNKYFAAGIRLPALT